MIYLIETYWLWSLLALLLGAVIGWAAWSEEERETRLPDWLKWGGLIWLLGLVVALFRWFGGRIGLLLETALLFFVAYLAGCFVAAWMRGLARRSGQPTEAAVEPATVPVAPVMVAAATAAAAPVAAPVTPITTVPAETPAPAAPVASAAAAPAAEEGHPGAKPTGLAAPREGKADDLKRIKGIGPQNESRLHGLGVWHFDQIAAWTPANVEWVGDFLAFPGRIEREDWVGQAKLLARGLQTEFSKRVDAGLVETSKDDGNRGQQNVEKIG